MPDIDIVSFLNEMNQEMLDCQQVLSAVFNAGVDICYATTATRFRYVIKT